LAVPFVLHTQPTASFGQQEDKTDEMAAITLRRYLDIMRDVEELINDHSMYKYGQMSKLPLTFPGS
jgi:IMP and pyridine-specific 5'-nucleotidase